jgi:hypothetical protein
MEEKGENIKYKDVDVKKLAEEKQRLYRELVAWHLRYVREKREKAFLKCRSFREFVRLSSQFELLDLLAEIGVPTPLITSYQGFLLKILRDWWEYIFPRLGKDPQEEIMNRIDKILTYYEEVYASWKQLDPEVLGKIESLFLAIISNLQVLQVQYEQLKQTKQT